MREFAIEINDTQEAARHHQDGCRNEHRRRISPRAPQVSRHYRGSREDQRACLSGMTGSDHNSRFMIRGRR